MNRKEACQDRREEIAALVLEELDAPEAEQLWEHIAGCEGCRALYQTLDDEEKEIRSTFAKVAAAYRNVENDIVERVGASHASYPNSAGEGWDTRKTDRLSLRQ